MTCKFNIFCGSFSGWQTQSVALHTQLQSIKVGMKTTMASPSLSKFCSLTPTLSQHHTQSFPSTTSLRFPHTTTSTNFNTIFLHKQPLSLCFALTESNSPNSTEPDPKTLLQQIAVSHSFPMFHFFFLKFPNSRVYVGFYIAGQFWSSSWLLWKVSQRSSIGRKCSAILRSL